jgi:predicted transposase/invertase (TIGR01784 family)
LEKVNNEHDVGYKYLLSSKKIFLQLLESFVHENWVNQLDASSIEKMDKSYILQDFKQKEADLVYKMNIKDREIIFYVLLELQSTVDFQMPYRLLRYMTEIWRDIVKNTGNQVLAQKSFQLPAIVPMVLYNGSGNWTAPLEFKEMLNTPGIFTDHVLNFEYILMDVNRYAKKKLLHLSNLIGSVFYLDQDVDSLEETRRRLEELLESVRHLSPEEVALFRVWLNQIYSKRFPKGQQEEIREIIDQSELTEVEKMISGLGRNIDKFVRQSREEGEKKKAIEVAENMLGIGMEVETVAKTTGLTKEEIQQIQKDKKE